jgi:hypothetical protein
MLTRFLDLAGGRKDVAAVYMWVNRQHINGWNFMSFCQQVCVLHTADCIVVL